MSATWIAKTSGSPAQAQPAALPPFISVIVPVRNEEAFIERLLDQLLRQDYDPDRFEVIVADGQSTDGTRARVARLQRQHPNLRLVHNPKHWSSAGRNRAIEAAVGEILIVVDGHCAVDRPRYLSDLAEVFARTGADCVGRPQPLDVPGARPAQRAVAAARSSWLGHNPDSFVYSSVERFVQPQSVAVAYRRSVFEAVGLFDEDFDACEDVDFNHRVARHGFRCYFSPRVGVQYHPRATLRGLFRQMRRYGQGRMRLLRKHPATFTPACFLPALMLLGVVAGPPLAYLWPMLALPYTAALGLYVAVVLLTSLASAWKHRDARLLPWLPMVFPMIHFGAGTGIWKELLRGWRRKSFSSIPVLAPPESSARTAEFLFVVPPLGGEDAKPPKGGTTNQRSLNHILNQGG